MFSGLFLGLGPTFDRAILGVTGGAGNGLVVALQPAAAAVCGIPFARVGARRAARAGASFMVLGAALAMVGIASAQVVVVALAAVIGGAGQGAGFGSSLRILGASAGSTDRGGLFSAAYLIAYAAYGLPVLLAGSLTSVLPLPIIIASYSALTAAFAVCAAVALARGTGSGAPDGT